MFWNAQLTPTKIMIFSEFSPTLMKKRCFLLQPQPEIRVGGQYVPDSVEDHIVPLSQAFLSGVVSQCAIKEHRTDGAALREFRVG
jgi:hypothetical protein